MEVKTNKIIFISSLFFITQAYAHNEKIDLLKDRQIFRLYD